MEKVLTTLFVLLGCTYASRQNTVPFYCGYVDVVFVIDGSSSVEEKNFRLIRKWLIKSMKELHRGLGDQLQVGILQYSKEFDAPFRLGDCKTLICMKRNLTEMPYLKGSTYTYAALKRTLEKEFPYSKRSNHSQKMIILTTDGQSQDSNKLLDWYHESLRQNITTLAIGISNSKLEELKTIANGGKSLHNVFTANTFAELPDILSKVIDIYCEDKDECELNVDHCGFNSSCVNTFGGYHCRCNEGYFNSSKSSCTDLDECARREHDCDNNSTCVNILGSYECVCNIGYEMVDDACHDIDECVQYDQPACGENAMCTNTIAGYLCSCHSGYRLEDGICKDIDECKENISICHSKNCLNVPGSFQCYCPNGYFEEEWECSECSCVPKQGFNRTLPQCTDGVFNCLYVNTESSISCAVPQEKAFSALFNAINDWKDKADSLKNRSEVVEAIKGIDEIIWCAASATNNMTDVNEEKGDIQVFSMDTSRGFEKIQKNFTNVRLRHLSSKSKDPIRAVGVQFIAPKASIELLIPETTMQYDYSVLEEETVFTGKSPIFSLSLFGGENFSYYEAMDVIFEVDIDQDFADPSMQEVLSMEGKLRYGYVTDIGYKCMFINVSTGWLEDNGCTTKYDIRGMPVTCQCSHTTMFAVLLTVRKTNIPAGAKVTSYIAGSLSVISLVLALAVLLHVRTEVRGDRIGVQVCLCLSVLILNTANLLHDVAINNPRTCEIIAVLVHYFLLASALWMLMEGVTLLRKTSDDTLSYAHEANKKRFNRLRHLCGWLVPFVIVAAASAIGFYTSTYMRHNPVYEEEKNREGQWAVQEVKRYTQCWLSENFVTWAVILPFASIMFVNCIIIIRMAYYIYVMSSNSDKLKPTVSFRQRKPKKSDHLKSVFKALVVLIPILGLSWILAFFTNIEQMQVSVVFIYSNAVITGLQGVALFIVYCIVGKEIRRSFTSKLKRKKRARELSKVTHSRYGRSAGSSSPSDQETTKKQISGKSSSLTSKLSDS